MDDEMIERCAQAARAKRAQLISMPLDRCYEDIVKAVVLAMREPTEKMKSIEGIHWGYGCHVCGGLTEGWHAMVDAIVGAK